ncbi:hypothetical protein, conserved [Eimeria acervulina]|uniref:Uncharacterized protein n=1 Tax=Eimeria acervulina TaxID=5801 RepID=U6GMD8_EIMAC|nr:hypothetical protein, conserved [Eimeria acervulina]CDI79769.1 hypothetical protein, conserved [Eimeria acervulina]
MFCRSLEQQCSKLSADLLLLRTLGLKHTAFQARESAVRTGRRVYSEVTFRGKPKIAPPEDMHEADRQPYVYLTCPGQQLLLQRDRIGHNAIGFEVSDEETGQVLAFGFIRFEDLYNVVKDATQDPRNAGGVSPQHRRFRVGLEHVDGRGPWGRLECSLDITHIKYFIRHEEKEEEQDVSLFQRRRARKKTDFQPMGAALAARSAARIREEPTHGEEETLIKETLKETLMKETLIKETLVQETLIQETLIKETLKKETLIQETLIQETLIQERLIKETLIKETLIKGTLIKETLIEGDTY